MRYTEFVSLVERMRSAQKTYFINHSRQALEKAKDLETRVDAAVLQVVNALPQQVGLFEEPQAETALHLLERACRLMARARAQGNSVDFWRGVAMVEAALVNEEAEQDEQPEGVV